MEKIDSRIRQKYPRKRLSLIESLVLQLRIEKKIITRKNAIDIT
jgi:hypothetical protein